MQAQRIDRHRRSIPVTVAIVVAVVGQAAILVNDFGPGSNSQGNRNASMISAAAVSRAGAIETPSATSAGRAVSVKIAARS
jgi:hypothetical protein